MNINLANMRQRWDKAKLTKTAAFWVAIGAVIFTMYLGFSRGGWVTGGTAQQMVDKASRDAVIGRLAPICVAQFRQDPEQQAKLVELQTLISSFQRANYVKEQGWATMPGEGRADDKVATECAAQILLASESAP